MQRQTGTTFVLVTHDQDEALAMATRIGLLHQGRLAQVGAPAELYERPASRFVAGFMGTDNVLPAACCGTGRLQLEGIGPAEAPDATPEGTVWVALRPERLVIAAGRSGRREPGGGRGRAERVFRATRRITWCGCRAARRCM